jgi:hypothetical protein
MQYNPHVVEPSETPLSPEEYAEWAKGYEMWLDMCAAQEQRVMIGGENTVGEPREFDW